MKTIFPHKCIKFGFATTNDIGCCPYCDFTLMIKKQCYSLFNFSFIQIPMFNNSIIKRNLYFHNRPFSLKQIFPIRATSQTILQLSVALGSPPGHSRAEGCRKSPRSPYLRHSRGGGNPVLCELLTLVLCANTGFPPARE